MKIAAHVRRREKRSARFRNPAIWCARNGRPWTIYSLVICHGTDEYMGPVKVRPDDPYICQFQSLTDEYKVIYIGFKTDEYSLNIFVGTDKFQNTDQ
jgi:hypothetical protein